MAPNDTIVALATARGRAALAIVRMSGPDSIQIAASRFSKPEIADAASHTAHVGYVLDSDGNELDQVVLTLFREPRSATGENIVEITCHGGDL
ncbi:MAG: tRNA uridine-5-carboxymethylaminomethyl(34) synthesis GTPase MnmE, partial [Rubricoccaceae bacterium]|nr:tRNA uridine-5-carboxymethylaminomethyl(34) synthesis GTPase MnmE [Rubricoccaceae bacterium]